MKSTPTFCLQAFVLAVFVSISASAQDRFVLENPGKLYKKQDHRQAPVLKTKYFFSVGELSGREYLKQQDLFDPKGGIKSSGLFSEDGSKMGDMRYTFEATGKLSKSELKYTGKNLKEITVFNESGKPVKIEKMSKTDSLIGSTVFVYNATGQLKEEQHFRGDKLIGKDVSDDEFNEAGRIVQSCHYKMDSLGARIPQNAQMTITEYDNDGLVLQRTVYNNKEKRKMLSWVYFKYQLDNDYKVIKQTGFNEEQQEIYRNELSYTDSSITSTEFKMCSCPEKTINKTGSKLLVFNKFGEKTSEKTFSASGDIQETATWKYDDFGNLIEQQVVKANDPNKLIKSKSIFEFQLDQAQTARKTTK